MKLSTLLTYLDGVDAMPDRWGCVVLVRDTSKAMDSPEAYRVVPVVDVRGGDDGRSVDLVSAEGSGSRRPAELSAREAAARLKRLAPTHASARLYARHGREHVRVMGATADPDLEALGFVEWFKGVEHEL